jgi:hypothetical protein
MAIFRGGNPTCWGLENSPGHYLDLASAVVALILFPVGYLWGNVRTTRAFR